VLNAETYFAHPYHSWERGHNENTNGLIRQYVPKGMSFDKLTSKDIKRHQKTSKDIKRHQKTSKDIKRHQKTSKDIKRHQKTSKDIKRVEN
jgi:hypothetical protein